MEKKEDQNRLAQQRPVLTPGAQVAEEYYNRLRGLFSPEDPAVWVTQVTNQIAAAMASIAELEEEAAEQAQIDALQGQLNALSAAISALTASLATRPIVYQNYTQKPNAKLLCKTANTASGVATFYLTDNGASDGNALFTNVYDETIDFEVNDSSNSYRYSWALSVDKKTLTVTVTRQAPVTILGIGVLGGLNPTPNNTPVRLTIWGD